MVGVNREMWTIIESIAAAGTLVTALIGLPIALASLRKARIQRKTEFLARYFKEYRAEEMGRAISDLWKLYRKSRSDEVTMIENYVKRNKKDGGKFHLEVRRKVSAFYQEMGFLAEGDPELRDLMFRVWTSGDLEIIRKIILPLELFAVPRVIDDAALRIGERIVIINGRIVINRKWAPSDQVKAILYNKAVNRDKRLSKKI
jgi:hypothetical protein